MVDAFEAWLLRAGWTVDREVAFVDLRAEHPDGPLLYVEAKGHTTSPGLEVDTLYGHLLRRMRPGEGHARYAVVVPTSVLKAAQRVSPAVRQTGRTGSGVGRRVLRDVATRGPLAHVARDPPTTPCQRLVNGLQRLRRWVHLVRLFGEHARVIDARSLVSEMRPAVRQGCESP